MEEVRREKLILGTIALGAVALRLLQLGHLSLAGDEETTALAALALLDGWPPTLPGGLVYIRALPFTAMEAASVALFGSGEWALRWVPALLAGPRMLAVWWFARPLCGPRLALLAALVLALAPLDIEQSRNARMYSLFATLDLLTLAAVIHAAINRRRAATAVALGFAAMTNHVLAVTHVFVPFACAVGRGLDRRRRLALLGIGGSMIGAYLLVQRHVTSSYEQVAGLTPGEALESSSRGDPLWDHLGGLGAISDGEWSAVIAALALVLSFLLLPAVARRLPGVASRLAAFAAIGAFAFAVPAIGVLLLLATLALAGIRPARAFREVPHLFAAVGSSTVGWFAAGIVRHGPSSSGLEAAARVLLEFPAPNWFEMASAGPIFFLLCAVGALVATDRAARSDQPGIYLALFAAAFAPALLTGLVERNGGIRFHLHTLGPLVILAILAIDWIVSRFVANPRTALALTAIVAVLAGRPDHAFDAVFREHGPTKSPWAANVAPDHRGAANYVRAHAVADDWIAAEDVLQQRLMIGRSELWLRRESDARSFVRKSTVGGPATDIYTGATLVGDLDALFATARDAGREVVWLITSAECEAAPRFFRTPETDRRLRSWRPMAWFVGEDGMTRVYRLVNGVPEPPSRLVANTRERKGAVQRVGD